MNRKSRLLLFLIAGLALLLFAGDHPLVEHWGDMASSGAGTFGSQWIHTDTSGVRYGLWGESASADARGVFGSATTTDDSGLAIGVYGETDSPTGRGVHGFAWSGSGINYGVTGSTLSTEIRSGGVYGFSNSTFGPTRGTLGQVKSPDGNGVLGFLWPSGAGYGAAVYAGNLATSGASRAIEAHNASPDGWSGYFASEGNGIIVYTPSGKAGFVVNGGSKNASVATLDGDRLLYSEESTEVWFSDYGFGQLQNGFALIRIDPIYAQTVNLINPYHVFLQAYGNAELYVDKRDDTSFEVWATDNSNDKNSEFSFRIVAKRLEFEEQRLEFSPWVTEDSRFFQPEPPEPPSPPLIEASEVGQ